MKQLLGCHRVVAKRRGLFWPLVPGILLGLIVGGMAGGLLFGLFTTVFGPTYPGYSVAEYQTYDRRQSRAEMISAGFAVPAGFAVGGLVVWLRLRSWRRAQERAEQDLAAKIEALLGEFPEVAQAWGGPPALRDRDIVQEMLRHAEASRRGSGGPTASGPGRRRRRN
jgi:hypothetical protein